jgi:hypothetical protein
VSIKSAWNDSPSGYNTLSGTSMATPHVSGAAALLLSRNPTMSPADVQQTMINNASLNVVGANKGSTPNRFLYIPETPPPPPNCATLKPGDAWAGVGLYCGLGKTASTLSGGAPTSPSTVTPIGITAADTAGSALARFDPASAPAAQPASAPAEPASTQPDASGPQAPSVAQPRPATSTQQATPGGPVPLAANNAGFGHLEAAAAPALPTTTPDGAAATAVDHEPADGSGPGQAASNTSSTAWAIAAGLAFCAVILLYPLRKRSIPQITSGDTAAGSP